MAESAPVYSNSITVSNCDYTVFEHTLFLGCSIRGFTTSAGWNEQQSQLTVQLVEDTCTAPESDPKYYWDDNLIKQSTTAADPGFIGHSIAIEGMPVYFRVEDFEYSGIVQSWEKTFDLEGNSLYNVSLTDPREILDGVQLIIGEYGGTVNGIHNVFNVFGQMEAFGQTCSQLSLTSLPALEDAYETGDLSPDGAMFGAESTGYGGALVNDNGMPWETIKNGFRLLNGAIPAGFLSSGPYSNDGRVVYRGTTSTAGYGLIKTTGSHTKYIVDLSEIPTTRSTYRFAGTSVSLMEAISRVCADYGYDYYVEFLPCLTANTDVDPSGICKIIKIRTVRRLTQPDLTHIDDFVAATKADGSYTSASIGRELRNEPTSSLVIGGKKNTLYQIEDGEDGEDHVLIKPYLGKNHLGGYIQSEHNGYQWVFYDIPTYGINQQLKILSMPEFINLEENEILSAIDGQDIWDSYESYTISTEEPTDIALVIDSRQGIFEINKAMDNIKDGKPAIAKDMMNPKQSKARLVETVQQDVDKIYEWLSGIANDYYGRQFLVRVPYACLRQDAESNKIIPSESPVQEGWTDHSQVLSLNTDSVYMTPFRTDDGRIQTMLRYNYATTKAIESLNLEDYVTINDLLWIKANVEEEYVYADADLYTLPCAVVNVSTPIRNKPSDEDIWDEAVGAIAQTRKWFEQEPPVTKEQWREAQRLAKDYVGGKTQYHRGHYPMSMPNAAAFGLQSNVLTYGPWGNSGAAGKTVIRYETGLTPWEYNGYANMNLAASYLSLDQITGMQVGEKGSITVAGYPKLPLGAELGAVGAGAYASDEYLVENRVLSSNTWSGDYLGSSTTVNFVEFEYTETWLGTYGPSITNIDVKKELSGITTTYTLRTHTPRFGVMAKFNADRIKQISQNRMKASSEFTRKQYQKFNNFKTHAKAIARIPKEDKGHVAEAKSPHEVLVGQLIDWTDDYTRPLVVTESITDVNEELRNSEGKAFMSLDGLFRPMSLYGAEGLPRRVNPLTDSGFMGSRGIVGPVRQSGDADVHYHGFRDDEKITAIAFNPFACPDAGYPDYTVSYRSNTPDVGHDIDIVGRTGEGSGLIIPIADSGYGYQQDYKFIGLKGPIFLTQWGFDLDGKPVPNEADDYGSCTSGIFTDQYLTNKFLDGHLQKSETWPVAPIDLRLDRDRGVWVSPPAPRPICATLQGGINNTGAYEGDNVAYALIDDFDYNDIWDSGGGAIDTPIIYVRECLGKTYSSGDKVIAIYDPLAGYHKIIEGPDPEIPDELNCTGEYIVTFVSNVECSGEDMVLTTGVMIFNSCGHLTNMEDFV